ncbi:MAG: hypothetical protein L3J89_11195 [Gammaproteobacteria bacterium]|nr:hypothetical protein [Gammaproteobacteria bacterium]
MSTTKKPPNVVEKSAAPAVADTKPAAAPKAAKKPAARAKKTAEKSAATGFASRRVWPD